MANHCKVGSRYFPYAIAVKEANCCHQHKWCSCRPCLDFWNTNLFTMPPAFQRARALCSSYEPYIKFFFSQRLLQQFQNNLCQWKCCGGMNTVLQPESALEIMRTKIILGFLCHQHREESVMGRQFWLFPSPLSTDWVFSLCEMGCIQTLLLLWVHFLILCPSVS